MSNPAPYRLHPGDALELMRSLEPESVDALITDPPYGTTQLAWDKPIDWLSFWTLARRVCKPTAVQVVFSAQPFTTDLIASNRKRFRYEIIWPKTTSTGFLDANRRPLRAHENIVVFQDRTKGATYNPQKTTGHTDYRVTRRTEVGHYGAQRPENVTVSNGDRYPTTVLPPLAGQQPESVHPTQKPVELMAWLVRTYTNPGDLVLDPFAGSGSTGVAALREGRQFVGSELVPEYQAIAEKRLAAAWAQPRMLEATP